MNITDTRPPDPRDLVSATDREAFLADHRAFLAAVRAEDNERLAAAVRPLAPPAPQTRPIRPLAPS